MEDLAPPLRCVLELQWSLENGLSARVALLRYIESFDDDWTRQLKLWLVLRDQGQLSADFWQMIKSPHRRAMIEILESGLQGQPVRTRLDEIRVEVQRACDDQLQRHLARLPFLGLIPLMLFQFPAFLILLLFPLLQEFHRGLL